MCLSRQILLGLIVISASAREISLRELSIKDAKEQSGNQTQLNLPSNYSSIRENVTNNFSCKGRQYGYYADVDNDCQVFHVCLPVDYGSSRRSPKTQTFTYSFICPSETAFDQAELTCVREEQRSIECEESPMFYDQNYESSSERNASRTMEVTTYRPIRTTSKTFQTADLFRKSGVSEKIIQKLPAHIVQQSMEQAETLEDAEVEEISMPLIQLDASEADSPVLEVANQLETQTPDEGRASKGGRKGFLFRADAVSE